MQDSFVAITMLLLPEILVTYLQLALYKKRGNTSNVLKEINLIAKANA